MLVELCVLTAAYQEHRKAREDPKDLKKKGLVKFVPR